MREPVPCVNCGTFFVPRNRNQNYCLNKVCQRARKASWEKQQRHTNLTFNQNRRLSQKKWLENTPGYWKDYRHRHPGQVERNRALQKIRNRRRKPETTAPSEVVIAKTDAREAPEINLCGPFWLVPVIAKTDAVKIYFRSNSEASELLQRQTRGQTDPACVKSTGSLGGAL